MKVPAELEDMEHLDVNHMEQKELQKLAVVRDVFIIVAAGVFIVLCLFLLVISL